MNQRQQVVSSMILRICNGPRDELLDDARGDATDAVADATLALSPEALCVLRSPAFADAHNSNGLA